MTAARRIAALAVPALVAGASLTILSGCGSRAPISHAAAVDRAACRHRADEVYALQNRGDRFRADTYATSTRDAPFASTGLPGNPTNGLSASFARQQMENDCLNSRAGNVGTTPAAPGAVEQ
jgi:hypothetical protein